MNNLQAQSHESTAFLTDMYELTMLDAAFKDGTAPVSYTHLTLPTILLV